MMISSRLSHTNEEITIKQASMNIASPHSSLNPNMSDPEIHVALFPGAGMGHLNPFLRFAASLVQDNVRVTLITAQPTVSLAESDLLSRFRSSFPEVTTIDFHLLPLDSATVNSTDPFWLRFEAIRRSAHLLSPLILSLSPPLSAFVFDVSMISPVIPITHSLSLPSYILFISSARMFSFFSYLSTVNPESVSASLEIPGISPIPKSSFPPLLLVPNSLFANILMEDSGKLTKLDGIVINSYEGIETESLEALNDGKIMQGLPHVFAIGPLACKFEIDQGNSPLKWLDKQPEGSVVYVSFGSRTAMSRDHIREIGDGLMRSGSRFLWVVKDKTVDRDEEDELEEIVGHELLERLKEKGLVVNKWVDQREVLGHPAVGGFVSHCGWNSVIEAAWSGVRILAWPQLGDQKINAEVVEMSGLGMWVKNWGWVGGEDVVKGEEIGKGIKEMMSNESLKQRAAELKDAARKAVGVGGSSYITFKRLIGEWKKNNAATI